MKCSLLTLSTFIDEELAPQRRAEVDAHLVGCTRCATGAATLREEKHRIGQLARVSVDPGSAQMMLEQVGIVVDPDADRSPVPSSTAAAVDERRPWQGGVSSAALPWTPRRPDEPLSHTGIEGRPTPPENAPDLQPDLPLDGVRAAPPSWDRVANLPAPAESAVADIPTADNVGSMDAGWADADEDWLNGSAASESWEEDLPTPTPPPAPPAEAAWSPPVPEPATTAPPPATPPPVPDLPLNGPPPTRVAAASGPAALWSRVHDAITVRLALSRSSEALDDSVQIVTGAAPLRGAALPAAPSPAPPRPAPQETPREVELSGIAEPTRVPVVGASALPPRAPDAGPLPSPPAPRIPTEEVTSESNHSSAAETGGWNAFAASSYPEVDPPADRPAEKRPPRALGRHSRAVAREQAPLGTRITAGATAAVGAIRAGTAPAGERVRSALGRVRRGGPDSRLLAGIAAIGLIFVVALLVGHLSSHPTTPTATRPVPATAAPQHSTPARPTAVATTSAAVPPAQVQTFGTGGTGFQVVRLRYGAQSGYMRVVFDLGATGAATAGTPRVTIAFTNPTTMLVTFAGTVPAGSTGTPTAGKVISSVSLVSSSSSRTVYRFGLTRAATATAFYLASPTRFVLDVH